MKEASPLYPGRDVTDQLEGLPGVSIVVFPLGVRNFRKFGLAVDAAITKMNSMEFGKKILGMLADRGKPPAEENQPVAAQPRKTKPAIEVTADDVASLFMSVPGLMVEIVDVVAECSVVTFKSGDKPAETVAFDRLPHWAVPVCTQAWIEETFGAKEKSQGNPLAPWIAMFETIMGAKDELPLSSGSSQNAQEAGSASTTS